MGAFCPTRGPFVPFISAQIHQRQQAGRRRGRHIYVAPAAAAPPSPTLAAKSADGADWHAIGRTVRDLEGGVLSAWPRSELQLQHAHRRSQLPRLGVRSTSGVQFRERPLFFTLLALGAYKKRYIHMVGRRGRRWATLIIFSGSTSSTMWQLIAHVQGRFRDTFPGSIPEIPGACESSQRAAFVGDTHIRTAGIVE